jgi:N-acetyltransferase 10
MPDILCAVQVALEGNLSDRNISHNTQRGLKPSGDLIPWNIREQFQDSEFPKLAGARIVRIATHSMVQKMGYGSKAISLLINFFEKKMVSTDDIEL